MGARLTASQILDRRVPEDDLLRNVVKLARARGWLLHHCRPAWNQRGQCMTPIQGSPGFVDLVLVRHEVLWRELKRETGRISMEQAEWIAKLTAAGQNVGVWRPSDWSSGEIERRLW